MGGIASALGVAEKMDIEGPEIAIGSKGVASISLLIHELTTNAIKYGALSKEGGRVQIRMEIVKLDGTENADPLLERKRRTPDHGTKSKGLWHKADPNRLAWYRRCQPALRDDRA
ncbi:hypothetical protein AB664_12070 [Brucella anthropi]|uniref:histidine kinase n=1 Tax=Brucella anthropi TaxID=529 RepID=A0A656Z3Y6_BRUAN|nr:hypothetical protein AB664_12070 [Brucella anthropi]